MTEQRTSPEEMRELMRNMVPMWIRILFAGVSLLMVAFAVASILKNGVRSWSFLLTALTMAGFWIFAGQQPAPARIYLKRPLGILYPLWIAVFSAWLLHEGGWVPAVCLGGAYILGLIGGEHKDEGEVWWRYYLGNPLAGNPLAVVSMLLLLLYVVWLAWTTGDWVPISCIVATFVLGERDIKARRRRKGNLMKRSVVARVGLAAAGGLWAWSHPSYWNAATPIIILVLLILLSSDIYLHTSSQEEPLALSHPQS